MPAFLCVIVGLSMLDNALASHIIDDELVRSVLSGDREANFRLSKYLYNEDFLSRLSSFACSNLAMECRDRGTSDWYDLEYLGSKVEELNLPNVTKVILRHEIDIIKKRVQNIDNIKYPNHMHLCDVLRDEGCDSRCSTNERNFIAHAGLEKNTTLITYKDRKFLVKYDENCRAKIENIIAPNTP